MTLAIRQKSPASSWKVSESPTKVLALRFFLLFRVASIGLNEGYDVPVFDTRHLLAEVIDADVVAPQCALEGIRFDEQHLGHHLDVQEKVSRIDRVVLGHRNSSAA